MFYINFITLNFIGFVIKLLAMNSHSIAMKVGTDERHFLNGTADNLKILHIAIVLILIINLIVEKRSGRLGNIGLVALSIPTLLLAFTILIVV